MHARFHGHADPCQGRYDQSIADRNKDRQHRLNLIERAFFALFRAPPQARPRNAAREIWNPGYTPSALDPPPCPAILAVMLQHNTAARAGRHTHLAHAAVVGLHAICCGLPALALIAAALSGAASATSLLPDSFVYFHQLMHAHELWILVLSAALVIVGGAMEVNARRSHRHGFPWLFALSVCCFLANAGIILVHRAVG